MILLDALDSHDCMSLTGFATIWGSSTVTCPLIAISKSRPISSESHIVTSNDMRLSPDGKNGNVGSMSYKILELYTSTKLDIVSRDQYHVTLCIT